MRSSIGRRLTIAFISLAISPLLLVGVILAWQSFTMQKQQALVLQRGLAQHVACQVTTFFDKLENELYLISHVQGLRRLDREQQRIVLSRLLSSYDVFLELALLDSRGQEQIRLHRFSLMPDTLGNRVEADEFVVPRESGQIYYGPIRFDEATGEPIMLLAVPILDARTGLVDGVLVSEARLKKIWDLIASIQVSKGQNVYIVDALGEVIAHRNPSVVLRGTRVDLPPQNGIQRGLTGSRVVLATEVARFGQQEFNIVVEQAISEAFALAINSTYITIAITVVALIVANSLGFLIVHQIVRPIRAMATTAQAISAGDLSQQVKIDSRDELGLLADAFNGMTVQLRTLIDSLEQRVAKRTAQLEAANKEMEAFSYSVSHDLRAPLRAIDGYTRLLVEDYGAFLDAEGRRVCNVVCNEVHRMAELIDKLLAFSHLSRTQIQIVSIDMETLAHSVFDELTTPENREGIELHVGTLPPAAGDPALIREVWQNLVVNALKFSSRREPAVIEIGSQQSNDETIYYVHDNGAGFDMRFIDKLFGVFKRLHSDKDFEGTGIGLATVQRIIQHHGGRVWADGAVDKGATFYFALPRRSRAG